MEQISKRIVQALTNLQLAVNEKQRLAILKKDTQLTDEVTGMLTVIEELSLELRNR